MRSRKSSFTVDPGWRLLMRDLGVRPGDVLRRADLPADLLARAGMALSTDEYFRLWRALEEEAADPLFPLRLAERYSAEAFQPALFAALCSPNLRVAVERLSRYKRLIGPMALDVDERKQRLTLRLRWLGSSEPPPEGLVLSELAFLVRLARLATREPIRAVGVTLPAGKLPLPAPYEQLFGRSVQRGAVAAIVFTLADAQRPFLTANDGMWALFEPELRRRLADIDAHASASALVRAALLELLPGGGRSIDDVARKLAVSRRTLQRRLQQERRPFHAVLDATRKELALHYLGRTSISAAEISFLLGFADPSSFFRAFRAWTGKTPQRVRDRLAAKFSERGS